MALSTCRECQGSVSTEAMACPHCGAPRRVRADRDVVRPTRWSAWIVAILFIGGCVAIFMAASNKTPRDDDRTTARVDAIETCHKAAKAGLMAPASAEFPSPYRMPEGMEAGVTTKRATFGRETMEPGTWLIRSFVDAQNSFGAKIRTRFACAVGPTGQLIAIEFSKP